MRYLFKIFVIASIVFFTSKVMYAQDVGVGKSFIKFKSMRMAVAVSGEFNFAAKDNGYFIKEFSNVEEEKFKFKGLPYIGIGLGIDIYSPLSTLGFYIEPNYNFLSYSTLSSSSFFIDSTYLRSIDIPFYLKLRFGKFNRPSSVWWAFGAGYSIPISVKRNTYFEENLTYTNEDKKQFENSFYASTIFGYEAILPTKGTKGQEMYTRDNIRLMVFFKADYDITDRINSSYNFNEYNSGLTGYKMDKLKFVRVSVGVKFFFRVTKALAIINELKESSE